MKYAPRIIEEAAGQFASLPGVGRKTALRLVLELMKRPPAEIEKFSAVLNQLAGEIRFCKYCHIVSDTETCTICANPKRDQTLLCVVADLRDVMAIENTQQYQGLYHILGGIISPMEGIGPNDLNIQSLLQRLSEGSFTEVVLALNSGTEGETTNFYLFRKMQHYPVIVSNIARGIAIGDEIEYADEVTLGKSILNRTPFENTFQHK